MAAPLRNAHTVGVLLRESVFVPSEAVNVQLKTQDDTSLRDNETP